MRLRTEKALDLTTRSLIYIAAICFACAACTGAAERVSPKQHAKWRLACRAAATRVIDDLGGLADPTPEDVARLTDALFRDMRDRVSEHRTEEESRRTSREFIAARKRGDIEQAVSNTVRWAATQTSLPLTGKDVLQQVGSDWPQKRDAAVNMYLEAVFEPVFKEARSRAVAVQKQTVEAEAAFPAQKDVDEKVTELAAKAEEKQRGIERADFDDLSDWIEVSVGQKDRVLFQEVQQHAVEMSRRMAGEIGDQYLRQRDRVAEWTADGEVPDALIRAEPIAGHVLKRLDDTIQRDAKTKKDTTIGKAVIPTYNTFSAVRAIALRDAGQLQDGRLIGFLETAELPIGADDIRDRIQETPGKYISREKSKALLVNTFQQEMAAGAAEMYVRKKKGADAPEAGKISAAIEELLSASAGVRDAYRGRVEEEVVRVLPEARKIVAESQMEDVFGPALSDKPLSEATVVSVYDRREGKLIDTYDEALEVLGAEDPAVAEKARKAVLIEEAKTSAIGIVRSKLEAGYSALNRQMELVRGIEQSRLSQLEKDVSAKKPVDDILKEWNKALTADWKKEAGRRNSLYPALFGRTVDFLDKTVRQLYDARKVEIAQAAAPSEEESREAADQKAVASEEEEVEEEPEEVEPETPKEEKAEGETSGDEWTTVADVIVVLRDANDGMCEAVVEPSDVEDVSRVRFPPGEVRDSSDRLFDELRGHLDALLRSKSAASRPGLRFFGGGSSPEIRILLIVESREIRHMMSILLRRRVTSYLTEWVEAHKDVGAPRLIWTVGL